MKYLGLFVGIDRYSSTTINWLSSAASDATALYALFADSFGADGSTLLKDDQATRPNIESDFTRLASCDEDDVVIVAFSGHGTPTHELVTYDADPRDLAATCIPLEELIDWFSRIPARRLVCFLDCCFSGGMGAKVLQVEAIPRSMKSAAELLEQLSGEGRVILTASTATEEAWENPVLGHGLLTYHVLEALQGAEEVRSAGRVSVYRLLDYVSQRVIDSSMRLGKAQHPTLRGRIDGEFVWPVLAPGALYASYFPERVRQAATVDIASLTSYGFPQHVIDAWAGSIGSLNQLQLDAVNEFKVLDGQDLIVVAPTTSGKTMIGELAAMKAALERKRAFFLLPLKALVNDKYDEFTRRYSPFGVTVIRATGDIADDIPALMHGQYDVCLMTYEKFTSLVLGNPHIVRQVGVIVVDEIQMVADRSRGVNLEFLLTVLKVRKLEGVNPQLIALSGVIGDTNGLERWLNARLLRRNERPVPLSEGVIRGDGSYRYVDPAGMECHESRFVIPVMSSSPSRTLLIPLIRKIVSEGKQAIIFRETRGEARATAIYLSEALGLAPAGEAIAALPIGDPSAASGDLRRALQGGTAFHISDLDRDERQVIEQHFRRRGTELRVICATTTLAMGVNTPAEAVVIVGLDHPDGAYSVAEYKNMVGRAGRLGFAEQGNSYLLAPSLHDEQRYWGGYVLGTPEDVESRFFEGSTDTRSLVVRVLAAAKSAGGTGLRADDVMTFLAGSFGAFRKQSQGVEAIAPARIEAALGQLADGNLIESDAEGRWVLTDLGRLAGESGVEVVSILRLVGALGACSPDTINDPALLSAAQVTIELDDVLFPLNKKSKQKEPLAWPAELQRQSVPHPILVAMRRNVRDQHDPTLRAKKAVACLLWMTDKPLAEVERIVTQFGGGLGGAAGAIRAVAQRTVDLLPVVLRVAELLHPGLDLGDRGAKLLTRLEVGIPAAAYELASATHGRLARADYLGLLRAGFRTCEDVLGTNDDRLIACLGNSAAKVAMLRLATQQAIEERSTMSAASIVPPYEG